MVGEVPPTFRGRIQKVQTDCTLGAVARYKIRAACSVNRSAIINFGAFSAAHATKRRHSAADPVQAALTEILI